jgi:hypothetical protein
MTTSGKRNPESGAHDAAALVEAKTKRASVGMEKQSKNNYEFYEKIALECSDLWSEMKSAKTAFSHSLIGFF